MKKIISDVMVIISIVTLIWIGLSYIEVCAKNLNPNPQYSKYNAIGMLIKK